MLVASFFIGSSTAPADRKLAWGAMLVLAGAAIGSAVWFVIIQRWIIGAFCPYCMATHGVGVVLGAMVFWQASKQRLNRLRSVIGAALVGLSLAAVLATTQWALKPPPFYRAGAAPDRTPLIDPRAVPLVGSPDAPSLVTLLFDYNCPHCQMIHGILDDVIRRYDGKIAFVLCPSPMNNRCNPYVSRDLAEFRESCELAKLALSIWVADRKAFTAFEQWWFSPEPDQRWRPRALQDARAKAIELVGESRLDAAAADPWIAGYMQSGIQLFGHTIHPAQGGSAVPKLVYGSRWVTPELHDAGDLVSILRDSLGIPTPQSSDATH
jgi:hypothetical protein